MADLVHVRLFGRLHIAALWILMTTWGLHQHPRGRDYHLQVHVLGSLAWKWTLLQLCLNGPRYQRQQTCKRVFRPALCNIMNTSNTYRYLF